MGCFGGVVWGVGHSALGGKWGMVVCVLVGRASAAAGGIMAGVVALRRSACTRRTMFSVLCSSLATVFFRSYLTPTLIMWGYLTF